MRFCIKRLHQLKLDVLLARRTQSVACCSELRHTASLPVAWRSHASDRRSLKSAVVLCPLRSLPLLCCLFAVAHTGHRTLEQDAERRRSPGRGRGARRSGPGLVLVGLGPGCSAAPARLPRRCRLGARRPDCDALSSPQYDLLYCSDLHELEHTMCVRETDITPYDDEYEYGYAY